MGKIFQKYYHRLSALFLPQTSALPNGYKPSKVRLNGISVNYVKIGRGTPLLFIHGWANNWEGWIPLVKFLKKDFTLYLIDLPGFGHSDNLNKYDVSTSAKIVAKFIQYLDLHNVSVIGLSMGSFVAAETARIYPQNIKTAILLGPLIKKDSRMSPFIFVNLYLKFFGMTLTGRVILKKIIESRLFGYAVSKFINMYRFDRKIVDNYGSHGKKLVRIKAFIEMGLSVNSYDYKKTLQNITVSTLLVFGREDKLAKYKDAKPLLLQNRHLCMEIIPFCGHMPHWEHPKLLSEKIKMFVND